MLLSIDDRNGIARAISLGCLYKQLKSASHRVALQCFAGYGYRAQHPHSMLDTKSACICELQALLQTRALQSICTCVLPWVQETQGIEFRHP